MRLFYPFHSPLMFATPTANNCARPKLEEARLIHKSCLGTENSGSKLLTKSGRQGLSIKAESTHSVPTTNSPLPPFARALSSTAGRRRSRGCTATTKWQTGSRKLSFTTYTSAFIFSDQAVASCDTQKAQTKSNPTNPTKKNEIL